MSATNHTPNLNLSQFIPLDKPAWLGDYNSDMSKIDTAVHKVQTQADSMDTAIEEAKAAASAATTAAATATKAAQDAADKAQDAETTANNVSGTAQNAINIANQAKETAEGVSSTAEQALETATQAKNTADSATTALNGKVNKAGDTMTGPLVLPGPPTAGNQAATKAYVDSKTPAPSTLKITSLGHGTVSGEFSLCAIYIEGIGVLINFTTGSAASTTLNMILQVKLPAGVNLTLGPAKVGGNCGGAKNITPTIVTSGSVNYLQFYDATGVSIPASGGTATINVFYPVA